jgi:hypothetical protein
VSFDDKRICEIKYVGKEDFLKVKGGTMLEHYFPQIAYQLYISGYPVCDFVVYNNEFDEIAFLSLTPPKKSIDAVMEKVFEFKKSFLDANVRPPLTALDTMELDGNPTWCALFSQLVEAKRKNNKTSLESAKHQIVSALPHTRVKCMGVSLSQSESGRVNVRYPK